MSTVRVGNLDVVDLREWYPDGEWYQRELSAIDKIVIHHSVTPNEWNDEQAVQAIWNSHVNGNGWPGYGYHFLVGKRAGFYHCGDVRTIRAGVHRHNTPSIHVCVMGSFQDEAPSCRQVADTDELCRNISMGLGQELPVLGHTELGETVCPGLLLSHFRMFRG